MTTDYLIVGLGNPGEEYADTRHNIGWMVADAWAHKHKASWKKPKGSLLSRPLYVETHIKVEKHRALVVKPLTYMNNSGQAVGKALKGLNTSEQNVIALVDEYNFPPGRVHLKMGGSAGGHNGVASLIDVLGTEDFWRLRCGIGRDFGPGGLVDYVLSPFSEPQLPEVSPMIQKAVDVLELALRITPERAMNEANR